MVKNRLPIKIAKKNNPPKKDISNKIVIIVLILVILASIVSLSIYLNFVNNTITQTTISTKEMVPAGEPYEPQPASSGGQVSLTITSPEKNNEGVK